MNSFASKAPKAVPRRRSKTGDAGAPIKSLQLRCIRIFTAANWRDDVEAAGKIPVEVYSNGVDPLNRNQAEKTALAWAAFAFWNRRYYSHQAGAHRFHEVMDVAKAYGVDYTPFQYSDPPGAVVLTPPAPVHAPIMIVMIPSAGGVFRCSVCPAASIGGLGNMNS